MLNTSQLVLKQTRRDLHETKEMEIHKVEPAETMIDELVINGVDEKVFESRVDRLAELAFEEQCTISNPKLPLVTELALVYHGAYKVI